MISQFILINFLLMHVGACATVHIEARGQLCEVLSSVNMGSRDQTPFAGYKASECLLPIEPSHRPQGNDLLVCLCGIKIT